MEHVGKPSGIPATLDLQRLKHQRPFQEKDRRRQIRDITRIVDMTASFPSDATAPDDAGDGSPPL